MESITNILIFLCCILVSTNNVVAQKIEIDDSDMPVIDVNNSADQKEYKDKCQAVVRTLYGYLHTMTAAQNYNHKSISYNDRVEAQNDALALFVNKGEPVLTPDGSMREAEVEITTVYNSKTTKSKKSVKKYFKGLLNLKKTKTDILIGIVGQMSCSDIKKVGNRYECVVAYEQEFKSWIDKKLGYHDYTTKKIAVWIVPQKTHNGFGYKILLFDISADESKTIH